MKPTLLTIAACILLMSCTRNEKRDCENNSFTMAFLNSPNTTPIPDSSATIIGYSKGTTSIDTTCVCGLSNTNPGHPATSRVIGFYYFATAFTQHDWKVTFHPSGKEMLITNARFNQQKRTVTDWDSQKCTNDLIYVVNGVTRTNTGIVYESLTYTGYLNITY